MTRLYGLLLCAAFVTGCATPQRTLTTTDFEHWSISRTVNSELGMITLFDPTNLAHHESDPADWFQYDFAFANDLETGRFAAAMTDRPGTHQVRITTGSLSFEEKLFAGPRATLRLRIINGRLLLAGGDAWPSQDNKATTYAHDPRWIHFENGDYEVIVTALDRLQGAQHDLVFQLLIVEDMLSVSYAPGIPYLVPGQPPGVAGLGAGGLHFHETCADVPKTAMWSPLTTPSLPMPGSVATLNLVANLQEQGQTVKVGSASAALPIVVARSTAPGSVGIYIEPDPWPSNAIAANGEVPVTTRMLCAVKINGVEPGIERFALQIEPLTNDHDPLPPSVKKKLTTSFERWVRLTSDPAWHYKSAQINRTRADRNILLGIMDYLPLNSKHAESLLIESNSILADRLIEHMTLDEPALSQ